MTVYSRRPLNGKGEDEKDRAGFAHSPPGENAMFDADDLSLMQLGRLNAALDKQYRFLGVIKTLRRHIEDLAADGPLEPSDGDGMIDYSRTHFNRLASQRAQDAYIARLKSKRYFYVNGWVIPKIVHDAIERAAAVETAVGRSEASGGVA